MLIDIMPGAASVAPTSDATGKSSSPSKGPGSFEALLNAASDDGSTSSSVDTGADESSESAVVTVIVPFVPVIPPQEPVACDEAGESHIANEGDGSVAIDAAAAAAESAIATAITSQADVAVSTDSKPEHPSIAIGEPSAPAPKVEPQRQRDQRPRVIDPIDPVGIFETVKDGNTGVVSPNADEPVEPVVQTPGVRSTTPAPRSVTPQMAAGDVQPPVPAEELMKAAAQQDVKVEASVVTPEPAQNGIAIGEPGGGSRGAAGRLARILDHLGDPPMVQATAAAAGENTPSFTPGGNGQSSFGDWLREQLPQAVTGGRAHASLPTFNIVNAIQGDSRAGEVLAAAGSAAMPGVSIAVGEHDVTSQLVQSLRMQFRDGIGEAVLKLKPEHLGTVSISLKVENGGLKANVQAEMPAVRQWLESQQDTLRNALADHGLRLDRFEVEPDGQRQSHPDQTPDEPRPQRRQQARRLPQPDQPVFEVVV
jgi:hypothetical protein